MIDKCENKLDAQIDYVKPVSIKNFCNNHNAQTPGIFFGDSRRIYFVW